MCTYMNIFTWCGYLFLLNRQIHRKQHTPRNPLTLIDTNNKINMNYIHILKVIIKKERSFNTPHLSISLQKRSDNHTLIWELLGKYLVLGSSARTCYCSSPLECCSQHDDYVGTFLSGYWLCWGSREHLAHTTKERKQKGQSHTRKMNFSSLLKRVKKSSLIL